MLKISKRQNEDKYLKVQFAARQYYNKAETLNRVVWILCLFSALLSLFANIIWLQPFLVVIVLLLEIGGLITERRMKSCVYIAATCRRKFDLHVFNLKDVSKTEPDKKIEEYIIKEVNHNPAKCDQQIKNTATDKPPGVKDWYDTSGDVQENEAIYECQRQNVWWDRNITKWQMAFALVAIAIFILGMLIIMNVNGTLVTILVVLGFPGLIMKAVERGITCYKYWRASIAIDTIVENRTALKESDGIVALQNMIDDRRAIPLVLC